MHWTLLDSDELDRSRDSMLESRRLLPGYLKSQPRFKTSSLYAVSCASKNLKLMREIE